MNEQRVRPRRLRLEATSVCQLRCPECPTASGETKPVLGTGHLRLANFQKLLDANPDLAQVELSNYGELFLNPELEQILAYAHERGVPLTADNGANLNTVRERVLEALVKYRFRRITCSIDGASAETYSQYRVGGDFEQVMANIGTINAYKKQYGSVLPRLVWQFVVFPHNRHEVEKARAMAKELGMGFYEKLSWGAPSGDLVQIDGADSRDSYREKYGVNYMRPICHQLWRVPQVNWDGRMLGCCRNYWGEFGGNVFSDGLEATVNSEPMQYARGMLQGQRPAREGIPCTTCELYLDMQQSGRWLTRTEVHTPAAVLDGLTRRGLRNRFTIGATGNFFRMAEAGYFAARRLRQALRRGA